MAEPVLILTVPPLLLASAMGVLSRIGGDNDVAQELRRKALHIGIGLGALALPMFFETPSMILTALAAVIAWMLCVRYLPSLKRRFGRALQGRKDSWGEIYYAVSIAFLLLVAADEPLLFAIPLLILALADGLAAVVGRAFPYGPLRGVAGSKTMAGTLTFFAVAFLCTFVPLQSVSTSLLLATVCCAAELLSRRGLDNLTVPAAAYLVLLLTGG